MVPAESWRPSWHWLLEDDHAGDSWVPFPVSLAAFHQGGLAFIDGVVSVQERK